MRPTGTAEELESRRRKCFELLESGKTATEVAELLGMLIKTSKLLPRCGLWPVACEALTHCMPVAALRGASSLFAS